MSLSWTALQAWARRRLAPVWPPLATIRWHSGLAFDNRAVSGEFRLRGQPISAGDEPRCDGAGDYDKYGRGGSSTPLIATFTAGGSGTLQFTLGSAGTLKTPDYVQLLGSADGRAVYILSKSVDPDGESAGDGNRHNYIYPVQITGLQRDLTTRHGPSLSCCLLFACCRSPAGAVSVVGCWACLGWRCCWPWCRCVGCGGSPNTPITNFSKAPRQGLIPSR